MTTINYTTNLSLAEPVTGTESGTWGDDVNKGLTDYLDIAIAGTLALTSSSFTANALTLANTTGNNTSNGITTTTAQYYVLKVSSLAANVTITAPTASKSYIIVNNDPTYTVTIKASGQSGVTIPVSSKALVVFNGTDYAQVGASAGGSTTQVQYNSSGALAGSANFTFNGTTATINTLNLTNALGIAYGGTGQTTASAAFNALSPVTTTGDLIIGNGTNSATRLAIGSNTYVLTSNGTTASWAAPTAQVYPGAGIPNSTGSAWGTSYSTTGSGTVVALATSPTLTTPVLGTPSSGTLSNCTVDGTNGVGYINIPINSQSAAYTLVLSDAGKAILHPSTDANARTFTIPANSSVAFPVGTAVSFINMTSQVVSIAITSDTLYLSSAGTTGTRSLAQYGTATAVKMTSTTWIISGSGLT